MYIADAREDSVRELTRLSKLVGFLKVGDNTLKKTDLNDIFNGELFEPITYLLDKDFEWQGICHGRNFMVFVCEGTVAYRAKQGSGKVYADQAKFYIPSDHWFSMRPVTTATVVVTNIGWQIPK